MAVRISSRLLDGLIDRAIASPQAEVCGLLFGTADAITAAAACANVSADPVRLFELDPAALIAAHRAARANGPAIVGHYHSHPIGDATPSPRDAATAAGDGALWLILGRGEAKLWRAVAGGPVHGAFRNETLTIEGALACHCGTEPPEGPAVVGKSGNDRS